MHATIPPTTAAAVTTQHIIAVVPESVGDQGINVLEVNVVPQGAVAGNATNRKNLNINAGTDEIGNLDLNAGTNLVARTRRKIFSGMHQMDPGDVLVLEIEKIGTGVAIPQLLVEIVFQPA